MLLMAVANRKGKIKQNPKVKKQMQHYSDNIGHTQQLQTLWPAWRLTAHERIRLEPEPQQLQRDNCVHTKMK